MRTKVLIAAAVLAVIWASRGLVTEYLDGPAQAIHRHFALTLGQDGLYLDAVLELEPDSMHYRLDNGEQIPMAEWLAARPYAADSEAVTINLAHWKKRGLEYGDVVESRFCILTLVDGRAVFRETVELERLVPVD